MKDNIKSFLIALKSIFSFSSVWNIAFPFFLGLFINFPLSDSRTLVIYLVWIPIFSLPFLIFQKKIFIAFVWLVSLSFGLLDIIHWITIKAPVSIYTLFVMFETSIEESKGFINLNTSFLYVFLVVYLFGSFFLLFKDLKRHYIFNKKMILFFLLFSLIFLGENAYKKRLIRKGMPVIIQTIVTFGDEIARYKKDSEKIISFKGELKAKSLNIEQEQVTVVVIGESTNRNHLSLYNYFRETNPLLSKRDDITVFTNVISPYTYTNASVRTCLTNSTVRNGIKYTEALSLIDVAKSADYKTYWVSNQSSVGVWDNLVALLANTSDEVLFPNKIMGSQKLLDSNTYDEILLKPFSKFLNQKNKKKLIIVHLLGTHSTYSKRYPYSFDKFKKLKHEKSNFIHEYDNAVLYNDFVVNSLIDTLKMYSLKSKSIANLVYFSDHGEIVYDDGLDMAGHSKKGIPSRHQVEIPFLVWQSDISKLMFPKIDSIILNNKDKAYNNTNLFHSVIDLMHVKTSYFIDSFSVFNSSFIEQERLIGPNGVSYENEVLRK